MEKLPTVQGDSFGVKGVNGTPVVSSRKVAEIFDKQHKHVLESIKKLECSNDFAGSNFRLGSYRDKNGQSRAEILMTKNGFTFLVMGFTGKKAAEFKEAYITRFDEMELFIKERCLAKIGYPKLVEALYEALNSPSYKEYAREADMLNMMVLGMTSKEYKERYGITPEKLNRDYMKGEFTCAA